MIYGMVRVSSKSQDDRRQIRNILKKYPNAKIVKDTYTGTNLFKSKVFISISKELQSGDLLVYDSASRMSRNEHQGWRLYKYLFNHNIGIEFLKDSSINTTEYRKMITNMISYPNSTQSRFIDNFILTSIDALNKLILDTAEERVKEVFRSAERTANDIHIYTKEGLQTAKEYGSRVGLLKGSKLCTKKSIISKKFIKDNSIDFDGILSNDECIDKLKISRNSFYKYKKELLDER